MQEPTVPDRSAMCAVGCLGELCATTGTDMACGGCCACKKRCQVRAVEVQLDHPLVRAAAEERVRVLEQEHYTRAHDDAHTDGELRRAAAAYALASGRSVAAAVNCWPWRDSQNPDQLVGFKPQTWEKRQQDLVKAAQFLMAEWDRIERDRLMEEAIHRPVLPPAELVDGDREVWWGGSGWWLQLEQKADGEHGPRWTARLVADGPPAYEHRFGVSQREAVRAVLREVLSDADADRLAEEFPDDRPGADLGHIAVEVHGLLVQGEREPREYVATVIVDGVPDTQGRGSTADAATQQALLNAGIAKLVEEGRLTSVPDAQQLPSRGWHPDQAVVETDGEDS